MGSGRFKLVSGASVLSMGSKKYLEGFIEMREVFEEVSMGFMQYQGVSGSFSGVPWAFRGLVGFYRRSGLFQEYFSEFQEMFKGVSGGLKVLQGLLGCIWNIMSSLIGQFKLSTREALETQGIQGV